MITRTSPFKKIIVQVSVWSRLWKTSSSFVSVEKKHAVSSYWIPFNRLLIFEQFHTKDIYFTITKRFGRYSLYSQSVFVHWRSSPNTIWRWAKIYKKCHITWRQNILTGSKFCWGAIFCQGAICRLCPDALFHSDKICSMDDIGVTVYGPRYSVKNILLTITSIGYKIIGQSLSALTLAVFPSGPRQAWTPIWLRSHSWDALSFVLTWTWLAGVVFWWWNNMVWNYHTINRVIWKWMKKKELKKKSYHILKNPGPIFVHWDKVCTPKDLRLKKYLPGSLCKRPHYYWFRVCIWHS